MDFPRRVSAARVKQHRRGGQKTAFRNPTLGPGIEPRWPDVYGRSMINNFHKTFTVQFQPKNQSSSPSSAQFPLFPTGNPVLSIFTPPNVFNQVLLSHNHSAFLKSQNITKTEWLVSPKTISRIVLTCMLHLTSCLDLVHILKKAVSECWENFPPIHEICQEEEIHKWLKPLLNS